MNALKKGLLAIFGIYFAMAIAMFLLQEKLIFLPSDLPKDFIYQFEQPFEEFNIVTEDGAVLNALHFKKDNPKGLILYFHGNAGNLARWGEITSYFLQYNYELMVMDYRSYGKSTGKLGEDVLYKDAELFYQKAREEYEAERIIIYGRSLGCTFATHLAAIHSPKMLILESPFYSLEYLAKRRYPILPVKPLLRYRFPSDEKIKSVQCQVTIIHGTKDKVVPFQNGKELCQLLPESQCTLVPISGGAHNDLVTFERFQSATDELFGGP